VQVWFTWVRPCFALSSLALSRPAGSRLLFDRTSTRLLMASASLGTPLLISSQAFASSAFLAAAAAATALSFAPTSCPLASAALYSFFSKFASAAVSASSRDFSWSAKSSAASPRTPSSVDCAAAIAAAAGALSALSHAASESAAISSITPTAVVLPVPLAPAMNAPFTRAVYASRGRPAHSVHGECGRATRLVRPLGARRAPERARPLAEDLVEDAREVGGVEKSDEGGDLGQILVRVGQKISRDFDAHLVDVVAHG